MNTRIKRGIIKGFKLLEGLRDRPSVYDKNRFRNLMQFFAPVGVPGDQVAEMGLSSLSIYPHGAVAADALALQA